MIILFVVGLVSYNRSVEARQTAALSSPNPAVRLAMVKSLVQSGQLVDALTNTEDPNSDSTSPQNVKSVTIRQNAAASVKSLSDAGQISTQQALETQFLLCKDADATVKSTAEAGLKDLAEKSNATLRAVVARLKDGDPDIRTAAVAVLGLVGADPGFGDKAAQLVDSVINDPSSQDSAESALQGIGAPAVPYLSAHLNDPSIAIDFRQKIIDILGAISTPNTLAPLTQQASSNQPSVKREAVASLANVVLNTYSAWQKATKDPKSKPADVQKDQAAFAQAAHSEPILVQALQDVNADSEVRSQAALALGDIAGTASVQTLISALGDYDTQVREAAIAGLQSVGPKAVGPLASALTQGDTQARAAAAEALGGIGNMPAITALNKAFASSSTPASVRRSAAEGLGRSGSPAAIPTLVRALHDPDGDVQTAASDALLSPQLEPAAVAPLIASFTQPTPTPFNASRTLARMGDQAVPALIQATKTTDPATQTWAAITLGQTGSKQQSVVPALTALASNSSPEVQFAAKSALNELSTSAMGS